MKTENSDNLSRSEKFDRVKDACRKQAKKGICLEIVFFILFIILIFNLSWVNRDYGTGYTIYACVALLFLIGLALFAVETFRFLKHLASVNTPEQLLHSFKRINNIGRRVFYLGSLGLIALLAIDYIIHNDDGVVLGMNLSLVVIMIAMLIYSYFDDDIMFRSLYDNPVSEYTSELTDIMLRTKDPASEEINDSWKTSSTINNTRPLYPTTEPHRGA